MQRFRIALLTLALVALPRLPAQADDPFLRTGTLFVSVSDDFPNQRAEFHYELRTDDGDTLRLRFANRPEELRTGDRIAVQGRPRPDAFDVEDVERLVVSRASLGREALSAWTVGAKRVLVILLNFTNDTSFTTTTQTNVQSLFFGTGSSVARFYGEASYGLVSMTGDVALVTATVAKPTTCDTGTIQSQANARALAAGYNPANYQFPVWVFPSISACGWSGLGYVGGGGSWINGAPSGSWGLLVAAHELGHNFGVLHAHSYDCGAVPIAPSGCTRSEYGDRFDVMGNSRAGHFNAQFKDTFGWLPAGTVKVHGGGSATYTLGALEATGQATYAVRIPTTGTTPTRTYFIEWRSRAGFDAGEPTTVVNGGLIRLAPSPAGGADLLDMTPPTATFDDAELDVGATFTDPELALTITTLSKTASSLTVQVDYGATPPATSFHTLTPCRVFDTRNATGPYGGPAILAGSSRAFVIRGQCGVPATARSIAGNFTVTGPTAAASLRVAPGGTGPTGTSTVSFKAGQTRANNVVAGLGTNGDLLVDGLASGTVQVIFDVVGWFE
jgi:gametolysin peptidase M11